MTFLTLVNAQSGEGPGGTWPSHSPATGATSCSPATSVTSLVGELIRPDSRRAPPDRDTRGPANSWPRQRRNVAKTQGLPGAPIAGAPSGQALRGLIQQPDRGRAGTSCPRAPEGRPPGAGRCRARLPRSCARHGRCDYLPDDLLTKMDIATMACSLEARAPLLDYRLVEWAARLPVRLKQRRLQRKRLLGDVLARRLPRELFERPKMGFTGPDRCMVARGASGRDARYGGYLQRPLPRVPERRGGGADRTRTSRSRCRPHCRRSTSAPTANGCDVART
jgi:hypothetical protein